MRTCCPQHTTPSMSSKTPAKRIPKPLFSIASPKLHTITSWCITVPHSCPP
jgi:hypothetical protein